MDLSINITNQCEHLKETVLKVPSSSWKFRLEACLKCLFPAFFHYTSALALTTCTKLICRRLIWGSMRNFFLVSGFQDHIWAVYSTTVISASCNTCLGGEYVRVSVSPLCPNICLPEILTFSANIKKNHNTHCLEAYTLTRQALGKD